MAITRAKVFKAADELVANGATPTWANVREHLGKGSFTTIGKWLKEWQVSPDRHSGGPPVPDALKVALQRFGEELWALALKEAVIALAAPSRGREMPLPQDGSEDSPAKP